MTTFDTKAAQIQAIRNGDMEAIRQWMDERPQNEYAVEKLIVSVLLERLADFTHAKGKFAAMSKEDLASKLLVAESALRVIRAMLCEPIGQAMVVVARKDNLPKCPATAYEDSAIEMMYDISNITLSITEEDATKFLAEFSRMMTRKPPVRKRKPPTSPSSSPD